MADDLTQFGVKMRGPLPAIPLRHQFRAYARTVVSIGRPLPPTRFVVFGQGRSGSTLLTRILHSGPRTVCDEELLRRPVLRPNRWVESWARRAGAEGAEVYGFKVKIYQLSIDQRIDDSGVWLRQMSDDGWRVIYLVRRNVVRQVLSNFVMAETRRGHANNDDDWTLPKVQVDLAQFRSGVEGRVHLGKLEETALANIDHLAIEYERDLLHANAHGDTLDRIRDFLGVERVPIEHPDLRRTSSDDLRTTIANYDEFAASLAGTPWAAMLDQP